MKRGGPTSEGERYSHIGQELFDLVEYDQGKGFISDGMHAISEDECIEIVRDVALPRSRLAVKKMAAWLRKYDKAAPLKGRKKGKG